jgi:hypothetical protein
MRELPGRCSAAKWRIEVGIEQGYRKVALPPLPSWDQKSGEALGWGDRRKSPWDEG